MDVPLDEEVRDAIVSEDAKRLESLVGPNAEIIEFGAGSLHKVRLLLAALDVVLLHADDEVRLQGGHLQEPHAELRDHTADVLIVAKLDRLSRSILDFAGLMETAKGQGWSVVVLDLGVDMTSTNGELIANIMMALAQWERKLIGDRTRAGLKAIRARGTTLGRPSGIDGDTLRLIRMLRESGRSWQSIADALTKEGVPTAQGGAWHGATVRKLYMSRLS